MFARFRNKRGGEGYDPQSSDAIYASGGWDRLRDRSELGRYSVIGGYCADTGARSVLDVGCGEGLLAESLLRNGVDDYVGVDFSAVAIGKAQAKDLPRCAFAVGDAQAYTPDRRFDAIVFNEVLYYLDRPQDAVARLAEWLEPDGVIIVSNFRNKVEWVWRGLDQVCETVDKVAITHGRLTWDLSLLKPRLRSATN